MWRRSLAGSLLVVLAVLSVIEISVDTATRRVSLRQQWQEQTPQQSALRLSHRTPATLAQWPVAPLVDLVRPALVVRGPDRPSPSSARVFVPPRS